MCAALLSRLSTLRRPWAWPKNADEGTKSAAAKSGAPKYKRVLLKISGEVLMGAQEFGMDSPTIERIAGDVKEGRELGSQVCLVIGGGNIFRGLTGAAAGIERASADYMGMLATVKIGRAHV